MTFYDLSGALGAGERAGEAAASKRGGPERADVSVCPLFVSAGPGGAPSGYGAVARSGCVAALGNFDGVHTGHRALIERAASAARENSLPCVIWTFEERGGTAPVSGGLNVSNDVNGSNTLNSSNISNASTDINASGISAGSPGYLSTKEEKLRLFGKYGADAAVFEDFGRLRTMTPESFVRDVLIGAMNCKIAVCGFNYSFGRGASGDPGMLERLMKECGRSSVTLPPVMYGGKPVSSTRIRSLIGEGDVQTAALLLGRCFEVTLKVVEGNRLGRTIGIPTINQYFLPRHIIPRHGVYASYCVIGDDTDKKIYPSVTNVGVRPTVAGNGAVDCESHIIGFGGDLYGQSVTVGFRRYLRPERKFPDIGSLKEAILADISTAAQNFVPPQL